MCVKFHKVALKCKKADSKNQENFQKDILELEKIEREETFRNFDWSFGRRLLLKT